MNDYLEFAKKFALEAGEIMRQNFKLGMQKEWKQDKTPVTVTDETINQKLIDEVKKKYPTFAVKGEEQDYEVQGAELTWVCDPVDGTFPFSSGIPIATFSLALVGASGKPQLGVVYDPFSDRLSYATVGGGVFLNSQPIKVSEKDTLDGTILDIDVWANRLPVPNVQLREDLL